MQVRPYGDRAVLVDVGDGPGPLALRAAVTSLTGVLATVPAARTLLIHLDPSQVDRDMLHEALRRAPDSPASEGDARTVTLPVVYDGPDLADLATELGLTTDEVVRRHASGAYRVAFCGFAPGFAYLAGLDRSLHARRLAEPRTSVPPGSVGIADEYTGVYPRASPGGWRLIGRTDASLWQPDADPPALLTPGARARFEPS